MRWVSSFFLTALPSPLLAAITSAASFSAIDFSLRPRENVISQRSAAVGTDFHRNLVGRTTNAAALHFDSGLEVGQRLLEDRDTRLGGLVLDNVHRAVENSLGSRLLALIHDGVDELRDGLAIVACVGQNRTLDGGRRTSGNSCSGEPFDEKRESRIVECRSRCLDLRIDLGIDTIEPRVAKPGSRRASQ
jgi:hypothetical protein